MKRWWWCQSKLLRSPWLTACGPDELTGTPPALSYPLCHHLKPIDLGLEERNRPCRKPLIPASKIVDAGHDAAVPLVLREQLSDLGQVKTGAKRLAGRHHLGFPGRELAG